MKKRIRYSLPLLLLLLPTIVFAQDQRHPIDKAFDTCNEKNPTTGGLVECAEAAHKKWDGELNKNYQTLLRRSKPAGKQLLKPPNSVGLGIAILSLS